MTVTLNNLSPELLLEIHTDFAWILRCHFRICVPYEPTLACANLSDLLNGNEPGDQELLQILEDASRLIALQIHWHPVYAQMFPSFAFPVNYQKSLTVLDLNIRHDSHNVDPDFA
ncbi:hypothetical protein BT69DRAFT_1284395, partial [Atractiella rhizophila]